MSLDLNAIRSRADAATPGPWEADDWEIYGADRVWVGETLSESEEDVSRANAAFIASARTDVPELLAEIERLTRERDDAIEEGNALARIVAALVGPAELPLPSKNDSAPAAETPTTVQEGR